MNFAEQLKNQLNIVDVVGQYVRLKRSGAGPRYVGLCPFHSEKTPSFGVHSTLHFYKCFGCDASGDVFKFVMELESLTFPETLKLLAERYGIPMPERQRSDDPDTQRRSALLEMHEIAAEIFQTNLRNAAGAEARSYLESRGVTRASMDEFRLGLSDATGQQLIQRLQKFGPALLEESGLAIKRQEGNGSYDRFRARLMFPIHSESGEVIAFGGRALRSNDEPKYLNSPETKIYRKSSVLYNLHRAKIDARKHDRMILVEGYMDVIGIYAAGIHEVVASCGTSLTTEQIRAIKRQTSDSANRGSVFVTFDPDDAGARSANKYVGPLLAEGLRVKVFGLPHRMDADEYVRDYGLEEYQKQLEGVDRAEVYHYWIANHAKRKFDMSTLEGRVDAFRSLLPVFQNVGDRLERAAIIKEMAEYLKVDREVVSQQVRQENGPDFKKGRGLSSAIPPNEKLLLGCLLSSAHARDAIKEYVRHAHVMHLLELRKIFEAVLALDAEDKPFSVEALASQLEPRLQRILTDLSFSELGINEEDAAYQAVHCLRALEAKAVNAACNTLRQRIRELEEGGNFTEALQLADELNRTRGATSGT